MQNPLKTTADHKGNIHHGLQPALGAEGGGDLPLQQASGDLQVVTELHWRGDLSHCGTGLPSLRKICTFQGITGYLRAERRERAGADGINCKRRMREDP